MVEVRFVLYLFFGYLVVFGLVLFVGIKRVSCRVLKEFGVLRLFVYVGREYVRFWLGVRDSVVGELGS